MEAIGPSHSRLAWWYVDRVADIVKLEYRWALDDESAVVALVHNERARQKLTMVLAEETEESCHPVWVRPCRYHARSSPSGPC